MESGEVRGERALDFQSARPVEGRDVDAPRVERQPGAGPGRESLGRAAAAVERVEQDGRLRRPQVDAGLVVPPKLAPTHTVIVIIGKDYKPPKSGS